MESNTYTAQEMREYADAMAGDFIDSNHNPVEIIYDSGIVIIECLRQAADDKERLEAIVKHLEKYKGTKEPDYCCADCIEDIAKDVGFSFDSGDGGAK